MKKKTTPGSGIQRGSIMKKKWPIIYFFSDDFGLRSPVIQKPFQPKNGIPSYLYTVARVISDDSISIVLVG